MAKEGVLYLPATATALKLLTGVYKTPEIKVQETSESVRPYFRILTNIFHSGTETPS